MDRRGSGLRFGEGGFGGVVDLEDGRDTLVGTLSDLDQGRSRLQQHLGTDGPAARGAPTVRRRLPGPHHDVSAEQVHCPATDRPFFLRPCHVGPCRPDSRVGHCDAGCGLRFLAA